MKTSIKTIGLLAALAMALTGPLFSQVPDLTKDTQAVDRSLAATPPQLKPPLHGLEAAGEGMKRLLGVLAPVSSGESRPTLKFAGSAPATVAIEEAFKMSLDNLIDINSIPYDPGKWNDTGLLETATDSRFLRAAPAYGENPWVHDGAYNTWSAMNLLEANDGRATRVARNTLWACCDMEDGKPVVNIRESAHSEWYMYQLWNIAAWHYYLVTGDAGFLAKAYEAATKILAKQEVGHFNAGYGLFEGSFFVGDGISGFPEPPFDPDRHSGNALDYPEVHKAMVLSAIPARAPLSVWMESP